MEYILKNMKKITVRNPQVEDSEAIIKLMKRADTETLFLARNPGEFSTSIEREGEIIDNILNDNDIEWFVVEYDNEIIGQCSVGLVRRNTRYRHRAEVAFVILKEYCNLGIGGKMMIECIKWCEHKGVTQIELDVVTKNERAIRMYEGFGFEIVGTIPKALHYLDNTYADEYVMVKQL
ncbi:GNAT family N-acetyltransferase [Anaerosporobacter faecicola]|uniref:GNAT family N-acetyltransferase n=1 Tax=Anaerosporobacter faecicola TaxID=2718714 RepID=UPI00143C3168|nr:GNAT family N-acetyltransferase [Anaerosporobacter faecicola]